MARPKSIQTESILEAARKVFMRDGYRAGTARIAREAGVSEGSIFKHFKSKANLFLAAMEVEAGGTDWEERLMASAGRVPPRAALVAAGIQLLEQLRLTLPRLMMINASGVTIPNHDLPGEVPHPVQKMNVLCRYFTAEIRAKRLAMANPRIQAHLFLGALAHYAWCETLFNYQSATPAVYVKTLVETLLRASRVNGRAGSRTAGTTRTSRKQ